MPAKSAKQEKFMQAVANNPKFAKKVGVPTSVGKEFTKSGGGMKKMNPGMMAMMKKKAPAKKMASGGLAAGHKSADGVASKGKTKTMQVKMKHGGRTF
jgi:hypothetical protein